jgi:hypothetical protein
LSDAPADAAARREVLERHVPGDGLVLVARRLYLLAVPRLLVFG